LANHRSSNPERDEPDLGIDVIPPPSRVESLTILRDLLSEIHDAFDQLKFISSLINHSVLVIDRIRKDLYEESSPEATLDQPRNDDF